ncbi:MAG: DUF599 domain-containing protein [Marinovum sp.]|nr:DUF599 domain-containing protein [Marinovum sp.]
MEWIYRLTEFSRCDLSALGLLVICFFFIGLLIENAPASYPSVSQLMAEYRRSWMRHMAARDVRIFDAQVLNGLRQGTAFFASATMLATGGVLALIGNADKLIDVADDLSLQPVAEVVWEIKLFLTLLLVTNAFLKFVWAHRLFGYCAILMAAVPNAPEDPQCLQMSRKAGEVNITAARSYNRGLRAIYFSIASIAWLISPMALMAATVITFGVLLRREFLSRSRTLLLDEG